MLFAERHRKLGRDGSLAHDRAEDLLTSTAFQLLRYLPLDVGLLAVLKRVRAVQPDGEVIQDLPAWLTLDGVTDTMYQFWPRRQGFGEPDVVITLLADKAPVVRLVVEVKLDAGMSRDADADADDVTEVSRANQLVRYWRGLRADTRLRRLGVVYLTTHAAPPRDELRDSMSREPGDWLGWLSWRDLWQAMNHARRLYLPASDLADILEAKGLNAFHGFPPCEYPNIPTSQVFWLGSGISPSPWFSGVAYRPSVSPRFWKGN